jgi:nucleotide-binding universal stress UspA family protein
MKTILVPVDFSENAKNAMFYAISIAKRLKMKLMLLHVFHQSEADTFCDSLKVITSRGITDTPDEMKNRLKIWREMALKEEKDLHCEILFTEGNLEDELKKGSERNDFDLIVMGTKGASGLKRIFIGSNTVKVLKEVSCPVIAVPRGYNFKEIKKIIFATDYHYSDVASIRFMIQLAKVFDAELLVVHVSDVQLKRRFEQDLMEYFMGQVALGVTYDKMKFNLLEEDDVKKALKDFVSKEKADLFALSTEKHSLTDLLLKKSLTEQFAYQIRLPLLTFHAFDFGDNGIF